MTIQIEHENSFRKIFTEGANLFLGAGFSVLAKDSFDRLMPVGKDLAGELRRQFDLEGLDALSLPQLCTILEAQQRQDFHEYLRSRFSVHTFDEAYNCLNDCSIHSIFTVNVDDLVHKIFAASEHNYLNDISRRGPVFSDKCAISYVPLHGSILNEEEPLIFSNTDIAGSFSQDPDKWHYLTSLLQKKPTLFWGCSLDDADVLKSISPQTVKGRVHKPKWITVREADSPEIKYYEALGFFIIIGDTSELLQYISSLDLAPRGPVITDGVSTHDLFPNESIPEVGKVAVRPIRDFYSGAEPTWHDIFSGQLYQTSHFAAVVNSIDSGKNTIVVGMPACGKTTLMMQIGANITFHGHKLVSKNISPEKAQLIVKQLNGQRAIVFLDDFTDSLEAFSFLTQQANLTVVAFDRDYNFDIASHRIDQSNFSIVEVTELTDIDLQKLFSKIPSDIRAKELSIPKMETGIPPSLYELVEANMARPTLRKRFRTVLDQLERESYSLHDFFVMCCYVHSCRSPVSYDMAYAFLRDEATSWEYIYDICEQLGALVAEYCGTFVDSEQDYFIPRSALVSDAVMRETSQTGLKRTILRFHREVSPYRICNYYSFKKRAYDKDIMTRAFPDWKEGVEFYESIYARDKSPYLLQQGALYLSSKHRFTEAFAWIDQAVTETEGRVFSIRNSHAIILFKANIGASSDDDTVVRTLRQSMEILRKCYANDKRKTYHAMTYADQALQYWRVYGDDMAKSYLNTAEEWLASEKAQWPHKRNVQRLHREVSQKLEQLG